MLQLPSNNMRHVLSIVLAMFGFMFDVSRLDVQDSEHVWRRCCMDVSWPGTSVRTTTRVYPCRVAEPIE